MTKHFTLSNSVSRFIILILINCSVLNAQPFKLLAVSDLVRIFEDGFKLPSVFDTINIFGIRGEIISGQCGLNAKNNLKNVSVETSPLNNLVSGNSLPANVAEWNFVGSIPVTKNTPNKPLSVLSRVAPARFPDYLMLERHINVNKGSWQAIWFTISIPENTVPGTYTGKITVKSDQGEQSLPISVSVYPLTLSGLPWHKTLPPLILPALRPRQSHHSPNSWRLS